MSRKGRKDAHVKNLFRDPSGQNELFEKSYQQEVDEKAGRQVECVGMTFESNEARRAYFLDKLQEKLKNSEFRKTEGFPIGSDEEILALSDPPYYTACPNPFIEDFIRLYSKPYDPKTDDYRREPFAADVSEGKNDPIYNVHSYHTKVPHRAIMRYILHYTEPGDVVFDGFCGTGMTGVAAQLCGDREIIESLGYEVLNNGEVVGTNKELISRLGPRKAVLYELSTEAAFIAHSINTPFSEKAFEEVVDAVSANILSRDRHLYMVELKDASGNHTRGDIIYTIWSDAVRCPECSREFLYSEGAVSDDWTNEQSPFECPGCGAELTTRKLERAIETKWDQVLGKLVKISKHLPVLISANVRGSRVRVVPSPANISKALLDGIDTHASGPVEELLKLERYFKDSLHLRNFTHVHHLYTTRTWKVLSDIWEEIHAIETDQRTRQQLMALFTSLLPRLDKLNRYMPNHQRHVGPLVGTLYVSWLTVEISPIAYWRDKVQTFRDLRSMPGYAIIGTGSSTQCYRLPADSVDYIFTDPPFGHNLQYAELNQRSEAWLKVRTNLEPEAVVSPSQNKGLHEYQEVMVRCFKEAYRLLKPGRWLTVEFHNSRNSVWNVIQESIAVAGFVISDVRTLDKKKGTTNQLFYSSGAVKQDLAITAYKPNGGLEYRFKLTAGTEEGVWDFLRTHLKQLPIFVTKNGQAEVVAERQNYLLFDRMVAFHVQRGVTVPLSAAEFYAGLTQRFPERDGMYFLPEQVAAYDKKRMTVREVLQLQLFVTDESSAIQWLKQQVIKKPQTFQELHPQFLKEIGGWQKHEKPLELSELLAENFLRYDGQGEVPSQIHSYLSTNFKELRNLDKDDPVLQAKAKDRWYVPDPNKAGDLEKLRERALLREFDEYRASKQKQLKLFRLEAVRAGFKKAWQERDYKIIIEVARRIPEYVLQEDPKLLMWYDQAITRTGEGQ
jgi:DNA modification methylase